MSKTPEELCKEWAKENVDIATNCFCYGAINQSFLAGYKARETAEKLELAEKYSHGSPLQKIAAEYVKQRGTTGPMAAYEENRFIDGYEAGYNEAKKYWANQPKYDVGTEEE